MEQQRIIISDNIEADIVTALSECDHDRLFVLTDTNTVKTSWPRLAAFRALKDATVITIPEGDTHKDITSAEHVWSTLSNEGATRHSCLINVGGGMVTDLGGFAASTFKRGINFINIPTTLLAMVDASVGGKTGINMDGLKNEIGVFNDSRFVIISTAFLSTLDDKNIRSGYAEMLKHGLIDSEPMWAELMTFDLDRPDLSHLQSMLAKSIAVKERIVARDPHEKGIRKALNFGHTFGHAMESWAMRKGCPILHGYAVAYGMVCELYLSTVRKGFPTDKLRQTVSFIRENYGVLPITCHDYDAIAELMKHDKKNTAGHINVTLLGGIGKIETDCTVSREEINEALDFYREG